MVAAALEVQRAQSGGSWPQHQGLGNRGGARAGHQSCLCPLPLTGSTRQARPCRLQAAEVRSAVGQGGIAVAGSRADVPGLGNGAMEGSAPAEHPENRHLAAGAGWARKAGGPQAIRAGGPHTCHTMGSSAAGSPPRRGGASRPAPEGSCPDGAGQTLLCWTRATGRWSSRCSVPGGEMSESGAAARAIPFPGSTDKCFSSHHSVLAKKGVTCPTDRASSGAHDPPRARVPPAGYLHVLKGRPCLLHAHPA